MEKELADLKDSFEKGTAKIHRPLFAWASLGDVHAAMDSNKKGLDEVEKGIADKTRKEHVGVAAWISIADLLAAIANMQKQNADVTKAVSEKTYGVPVKTGGWANAQQIADALANPKLDAKSREFLNLGLSHIGIASAIDIALRGLEITKLERYIAIFSTLAEPARKDLKLKMGQLARSQDEFTMEFEFHKKRIQRDIDWYKKCLTQVP